MSGIRWRHLYLENWSEKCDKKRTLAAYFIFFLSLFGTTFSWEINYQVD